MKLIGTVYASNVVEWCPGDPPVPCPDGQGAVPIVGFEGIFANILSAVLGLAGIVLFFMLIIGGFKYITSGGDPKTAASARLTITHAILGLVLVASAFLILVIIQQFTGAELTTFRIYRD